MFGPRPYVCYIYHGSYKERNIAKLSDYDIVFTTYATLSAEFSRSDSPLHGAFWFRIVLDEGIFFSSFYLSQITNSLKLIIFAIKTPYGFEQWYPFRRQVDGVLQAHQFRINLRTLEHWFSFYEFHTSTPPGNSEITLSSLLKVVAGKGLRIFEIYSNASAFVARRMYFLSRRLLRWNIN